MKKLQGLSVLLTRPEGRGDALLRDIVEAGGQAVHCPVMTICPVSWQQDDAQAMQVRQRILELDIYRYVIFISTNAVRHGMEWVSNYWPQLPVGVDWFAIGAATARALSEASAGEIVPIQPGGAMNSEALLDEPALQRLQGEKILIVRGVGGREQLASTLRERGAQVDYAECYWRGLPETPPPELLASIESQCLDAVCVNSGETLDNLCQLVGVQGEQALQSVPLVVPGQRVASLAGARGFTAIVIAQNASDKAVLEALSTLVKDKQ